MKNLFPKELSQGYRGHIVAKYVFYLITIVTVLRSLIHLFLADGGAQSIATIPLTNYSEAAAATVVHVFALWGLAQLLMGIVYVVVAWRYQGLIPFMYVLLLLEYVMRIVVGRIKPIVLLGTAPGAVGSYVFVPVIIGMLVLALRGARG